MERFRGETVVEAGQDTKGGWGGGLPPARLGSVPRQTVTPMASGPGRSPPQARAGSVSVLETMLIRPSCFQTSVEGAIAISETLPAEHRRREHAALKTPRKRSEQEEQYRGQRENGMVRHKSFRRTVARTVNVPR